MQRRVLSPAGQRRARLGRKVIASSRVASSIERRLPQASSSSVKKRSLRGRLPRVHYTFQRWHGFAALAIIILSVVGYFGYNWQHEQALATARAKAEIAQKAAVESQKKQQACMADVVSKKQDQLGKLTYDQLYDGLCQ